MAEYGSAARRWSERPALDGDATPCGDRGTRPSADGGVFPLELVSFPGGCGPSGRWQGIRSARLPSPVGLVDIAQQAAFPGNGGLGTRLYREERDASQHVGLILRR
jgi:hypothetical protein